MHNKKPLVAILGAFLFGVVSPLRETTNSFYRSPKLLSRYTVVNWGKNYLLPVTNYQLSIV
jgi:hypothetical protein